MKDTPEYSYRSKDVLYEVYLPEGARRPKSLSMKLVNPGDEDDHTDIRVDVSDISTEPTVSTLEELLIKRQDFIDEQSPSTWTGTMCGLPSVRRTTRGSFSLFHSTSPIVDDCLAVGFKDAQGRSLSGLVWRMAEPDTTLAQRDFLDELNPVAEPPPPVSAGNVQIRLRGFGVEIRDNWKCVFPGVFGEHEYGPWRPSPWGDEERVPGYKLKWGFTPYLRDVQSNIQRMKRRHGIEEDGHGSLGRNLLESGELQFEDYFAVDKPAVEHPKVTSIGLDGEEILIDDERNKYAYRYVAAWLRLGPTGGCRIWMRIENEILDQWVPSWSKVVSAVNITRM